MAGAHVLIFSCTDLLPLLLASLLHAVSLECDNYIIILCINTSCYLGSIENILGYYNPQVLYKICRGLDYLLGLHGIVESIVLSHVAPAGSAPPPYIQEGVHLFDRPSHSGHM